LVEGGSLAVVFTTARLKQIDRKFMLFKNIKMAF